MFVQFLLFGSICFYLIPWSTWFSLVLFFPFPSSKIRFVYIWFYVDSVWFYLVLFNSIWIYLVLFGPDRFCLIPFGPLWFYCFFCPIRSIWSIWFYLVLFRSVRFYLILFDSIWSTWFSLFSLIYLLDFGSTSSYLVQFVLSVLLGSICF